MHLYDTILLIAIQFLPISVYTSQQYTLRNKYRPKVKFIENLICIHVHTEEYSKCRNEIFSPEHVFLIHLVI